MLANFPFLLPFSEFLFLAANSAALLRVRFVGRCCAENGFISLYPCRRAARESRSGFHCVHLAQQVPALQPGGCCVGTASARKQGRSFSNRKVPGLQGSQLCGGVVEVRLLCHLHALHPAVPSTVEPFLSRVCVPSDHFQYSHPGSVGV